MEPSNRMTITDQKQVTMKNNTLFTQQIIEE
jgi:hypothetical protein